MENQEEVEVKEGEVKTVEEGEEEEEQDQVSRGQEAAGEPC